MYSMITTSPQIHGWHVVINDSNLNENPYWILQIQHVQLLQYDPIKTPPTTKPAVIKYLVKSELYK